MVGTAIVDNSLLCGVQRHLPPRRCSKALTSKKTTTLGGCRRRRCGGGVGGREEQREQGLEKTKSEMNRVPSVPICFCFCSHLVGKATSLRLWVGRLL